MVAVLTADLVNSSNYQHKVLERVLDALKEEFKHITTTYGEDSVRFKIYRGDSFQGVVKTPEDALQIALQLKAAINRIHLKETRKNRAYSKIADLKIAIGVGTQDVEREAIAESNGQAFQFSGRTLDEMKAGNQKTRLQTAVEEVNGEFNTSFFLLDTITDKWSTASAEVVYYLITGLKEKEVAAAINISQSAVNQRKKAAGWEAIAVLLERYREVLSKKFQND